MKNNPQLYITNSIFVNVDDVFQIVSDCVHRLLVYNDLKLFAVHHNGVFRSLCWEDEDQVQGEGIANFSEIPTMLN